LEIEEISGRAEVSPEREALGLQLPLEVGVGRDASKP
jgi:hypothetical protein